MSFAEIKPIRIAINDPDCLDILEVATSAALPSAPAPQTVYRAVNTGLYYQTDTETGATLANYEFVDLMLSDSTLQTLYDQLGETAAICRAFGLIARKLGNQCRIVRSATGAESTEYARVSELYAYYKALADDCKAEKASDEGTSTGRYGQMTQPEIAGGLL